MVSDRLASMQTFPIVGTVYPGAWFARMVKGKELFVAKTRAQLGY